MNTNKVFAIEFFIACGINSWGALKSGYAPWPPVIVYSSLAMAICSMAAVIDERLAVWLGTGFLVASIVHVAGIADPGGNGKWTGTFGAIPTGVSYDIIQFGSGGNGTTQGGGSQQGPGQNSGG